LTAAARPSPRDLAETLSWRGIGPYRGGRVNAVAGHPRERDTFWFGASGGGIWRTSDGGLSWGNVSDGWLDCSQIATLAVAPSDPDRLYAGTGDAFPRNNPGPGTGLFASRDGGASWRPAGLRAAQDIGRVLVHPRDPDRLLVAALGHRFGPNPERGLFLSEDGGGSWEHVGDFGPDVGGADLCHDGGSPERVFASSWRFRRTPWGLSSGGPGSAVRRSADGGRSWEDLSGRPGLPAGPLGRIGLAASPVRPGRVWALVEARAGGLYRSDDAGESWSWLSNEGDFRVRPWYHARLVAHPRDPDGLWVVHRKLWRSADGGRSFRLVSSTYWDQHDLWVDPEDPDRMIVGNDGGASVSFSAGARWSTVANQPTAELYRAAVDTGTPYRVAGSQQDNSTISLPVRSDHGAVIQADWRELGGGESGWIAYKPDDPAVVYATSLDGELTRHDARTGQFADVSAWPEWIEGHAARELSHRFNYSAPVVVSAHDPRTVYAAAQYVLRSRDEGASWEAVSGDLTAPEAEMLAPQGGPVTPEGGPNERYGTIAALAESPVEAGVLWASTDDGRVHLTQDDGESWTEVTPEGMPRWAASRVSASATTPGVAYLAATRYMLDDPAPYAFRTADHGATWQAIGGGMPAAAFVRLVRDDLERPGLLYAATERGVLVSLDDGASWAPLGAGLPVVAVHDLVLHGDDLTAATHGRGFWVLEGLALLRALPALDLARPALVAPAPVLALHRQVTGETGLIALSGLVGAINPAPGVVLRYWLPAGAERLAVVLRDAEGREVARLVPRPGTPAAEPAGPSLHHLVGGEVQPSTRVAGDAVARILVGPGHAAPPAVPAVPAREPGLHAVLWDLRHPGPERSPLVWPHVELRPRALPGRYRAELEVDGEVAAATEVEVLADPRSGVSAGALAEQLAFLSEVRDEVSRVVRVAARLERLALDAERLGARPTLPDDLRDGLAGLVARARALRAQLVEPGLHPRAGELAELHVPTRTLRRLQSLFGRAGRAEGAPPQGARRVLAVLVGERERARAGLLETLEAARGLSAHAAGAAVPLLDGNLDGAGS